MAAATLTLTSFTLACPACPAGTPVAAAVNYDAATRLATLTPTVVLPPSALCVATVTTAAQDTTGIALALNSAFTATITTAATDLAGNALAGNGAVLLGAGNRL